MTSEPAERSVARSHAVMWLVAGAVIALAIAAGIVNRDKFAVRDAVAYACPEPGTVYKMSTPLAMSADPGAYDWVKISDSKGYDCRIIGSGGSAVWMHAGLTDSPQVEWRAAAEELWPLKVGNRSHGHFQSRGQTWAVDYKVVSFEKYTARVGTYDTYKIAGTLTVDGKLVFTTTRWWSPDLRYTLSFRLERVVANGNNIFWEIAGIGNRDS